MMTTRAVVFLVVLCALLGLVIGSFLNVVVFRTPRHQSLLRPRSHCPKCLTPISGLENVPVISWLWLRGRCAHCHQPISARYPLTEAATGAVFAYTAAVLGAQALLPALLAFWSAAIAAALIGVDGFDVPPALAGILGGSCAWLAVLAGVGGDIGRDGWGLLGAAVGVVAVAIAQRVGATQPVPGAAGGEAAEGRHRLAAVAAVASVGWTAAWLWPWGAVVLPITAVGQSAWTARRPRQESDAARHGRGTLWLLLAAGAMAVLAGTWLGT